MIGSIISEQVFSDEVSVQVLKNKTGYTKDFTPLGQGRKVSASGVQAQVVNKN